MVLTCCEIRPSPIHGLGIFATAPIQPGDIIVQEKALWVVDKLSAMYATFPNLSNHRKVRNNMLDLYTAPEWLSSEERSCFPHDLLKLAGGFDLNDALLGDADADELALTETLREILIINGVGRDPFVKGQQELAAVYKESSRLNHSCVPNAQCTTGEAFNAMVSVGSSPYETPPTALHHFANQLTLHLQPHQFCQVTATHPIAADTEILINYADQLAPSQTRQNLFQTRWNFTCACARCSAAEKERVKSDANRQKLADAVERIKQCNLQYGQEKPKETSPEVWSNHLGSLNRVMMGEEGWGAVERLAGVEGVNDLMLWKR